MTTVARTTVLTVTVDGVGPVPVTVTEHGAGRPFLLLHGGAGPQSVAGFADLLGTREPARVLVPTHPGFGGTPRPQGLDSIPALARVYAGLLDQLGLTGVTVIGNSIGGWIAAEIALLGSPRVSGVILVDAAGLVLSGHPDAPARTLVMVPLGAPHTFANPGDEPAIILNTFTPDLYVQYFRDLRDLTAGGRPPSPELIADVMARYGTEPARDS